MRLEFLVNPRAAPRARARCRFRATVGAATFDGHTEDIGPHGCQLVSPVPVLKGSALRLVVRAETGEQIDAVGSVAWASPQAPWRLGVAFAEGSRRDATRLFDAIVASQPGLAGWRQVPDRISLDAMVWLAPPPRLVVDFTADEVAVLTAVGTGATVFELMTRLRGTWTRAERSFFSLLASRHLTLSRGGAVPFANWAELLHELQAEVAAASLTEVEGTPGPPPPTWPPAAPDATPGPARRAAPRPSPPPRPPSYDGADGMDIDPEALELELGPGQGQGARGLLPSPARARSSEAEEAWQQALEALAMGHEVAATALLRRAMALAPGDPEIARKLGEVAYRRR
jgi:hypothetical protein